MATGECDPTLRSIGPRSVAVSVLNGGNVPAAGPITLTLYASTDASGTSGLKSLAGVTRPVKIKPGRSKIVRLKFVPPADLPPETYYFVSTLGAGGGISDSNDANNRAVAPGSFTLG